MPTTAEEIGDLAARELLMADVLEALTGSDDLAAALQRCATAVVKRLDAAFARIWALDDVAFVLTLKASAGMYTHLDGAHSRIPVGRYKIGLIAQERTPHLTNDVLNDERISDPEWARREGMVSFAGYPLLVGGRLVGVLALFARRRLSQATLEALGAVADSLALGMARWRSEEQLRDEKRVLENLYRIGTAIAGELDLPRIVQTVTDAATDLTGAEFGAFFYNVVSDQGEAYMLYALSGAPSDAFADFPLPRNTAIFEPTFRGQGVLRLDDVLADPRYGLEEPYHGMPPGHLPVRSYLAVPVISRDGDVLGGLFFGHAEVGVFTERDERVVEGIAGHAAVAIESARMYEQARQVALSLQQSLLPEELPRVEGIELAGRYLPGSVHADVGGDWYDGIVRSDGRVMISVGDVVGHDLHAAAVMGQLRTAVRAYAIEARDPADLVSRLDRFMNDAGVEEMATIVQVCYDPRARTVEACAAGHPAPLLVLPGGEARFLSLITLPPVGCRLIEGLMSDANLARAEVPAGSTLVMFTDGLVERAGESLDDGLERIRRSASAAADLELEDLCDRLVEELATVRRDDVALLVLRTT